jgi:hypothetical protein
MAFLAEAEGVTIHSTAVARRGANLRRHVASEDLSYGLRQRHSFRICNGDEARQQQRKNVVHPWQTGILAGNVRDGVHAEASERIKSVGPPEMPRRLMLLSRREWRAPAA